MMYRFILSFKIIKYLLGLGLFLIISELNAQTSHFFNTRLGLEMQGQRDEGMSPLKYKGAGVFFGFEHQAHKLNKTRWTEFNYSTSNLKNQYNNNISEQASSIKAFTFYHPEGEENSIIHWGWSNINSLVVRENSSFSNYSERSDYFTSFGPAARLHYPFRLCNLNFNFNLVSHVQVLGFFLRPSLAINTPRGFVMHQNSFWDAFSESIELFIPGNAWNLGFRPGLTLNLNSGNKLSIAYDFDYQKLNSIAPLTRATGTWKLSLSARLNKRTVD